MSVLVEKNVEAVMRDGAVLRADVYRPAGDGRYPVLLQRTPYNKEMLRLTAMTLDPLRAAAAGYAVIIQDVRSRFASDGDVFEPYVHEERDGFDTVDWASGLRYCNGRVGCYGLSYMGGTSWLCAVSGHEAVRAISPTTAPNDFWRKHLWRDGAFCWGTAITWSLRSIGMAALVRAGHEPAELGRRMVELVDAYDDFDAIAKTRPLRDFAPARPDDPGFVPFFYDFLAHPQPDSWTDARLVHDRHSEVRAPSLIIAGWHDFLLGSDLEHFEQMRQNGGSKEARAHTRLVVGPWSHGMFSSAVGELDCGMRANGFFLDLREDLTRLQLRWFDRWLKDEDNGIDREPAARLFVQGLDRWRSEEAWPLARAVDTPWYLRAGGALSLDPPESPGRPCAAANGGSDSYVYDPDDPCPTCGGALLMPYHFRAGPVDQRPIMDRRDVRAYTSEPLEREVEVTGNVRVVLHASTSAPDTDWVVKLCDVHPDGRTFNVCDGVLRASHHARVTGQEIVPGRIVEWEIDLWATSMVFGAGHRLRLLVTSSDFPRYDRNPNTGEQPSVAASSAPALQRIYRDAAHPSHIVLPVVARAQ